MTQLEKVVFESPLDLQKKLCVEFDGEQGIDEGGLSKEFFSLIFEKIMQPDFGLFHETAENDYMFFNRFQDTEKEFMLVGMLIGLAIYNGIILDIAFPTVIFKKLAGQPGVFSDLEEFEPEIYRNLSKILEYDDKTVEELDLTFVISLPNGDTKEHELDENSSDKKVTKSNCHEYVELYSDFLLNKSIEKSVRSCCITFVKTSVHRF